MFLPFRAHFPSQIWNQQAINKIVTMMASSSSTSMMSSQAVSSRSIILHALNQHMTKTTTAMIALAGGMSLLGSIGLISTPASTSGNTSESTSSSSSGYHNDEASRSSTTTKTSTLSGLSVFPLSLLSSSSFWSMISYNGSTSSMITLNHCQVPCGIFDDPAIVQQLQQSCETIRKAIVESNKLHSEYVDTTPLNANQFIRWVVSKEKHADDIISIVSEYCLCQRVKRPEFETEKEYLEALKVHHQVLQAAMKAKQSMSLEACDALEHAVSDLSKLYIK
jgi:Nickel-containing superoxide dismutase